MPAFMLFESNAPVASWDLATGAVSHLSRRHEVEGTLIIDETARVSFEIRQAVPDTDYEIRIGELSLSDLLVNGSAAGSRITGNHYWPEEMFFESARGMTEIRLFHKRNEDAEMTPLQTFTIHVRPSKIGEKNYLAMSDDLEKLSKSLLSDLFGKSRRTFDLKTSKEIRNIHSKEEELAAIKAICPTLERLLEGISRYPSITVKRVQRTITWRGQGRLSLLGLNSLCRRGSSRPGSSEAVSVREWRRRESFDIPEHRYIKAFVLLLKNRTMECGLAARRHIIAIKADRPWRDGNQSEQSQWKSLYEQQDLPMISRLEMAIRDAKETSLRLEEMLRMVCLANVRPEFCRLEGGIFERSAEYRSISNLMLGYLRRHTSWVDGASFNNLRKLTSTIYEQWAFLHLVNAFRAEGVDFQDWNGVIGNSATSRFTIDFSRGLNFVGEITPTLRLRISYQPWIHNLSTAQKMKASLYTGITNGAAWSPDTVVEVLRQAEGAWLPVYVVVLDSKYTRRLSAERQWRGTEKYLKIRSTHDKKQKARQLWLIAPIDPGIVPEDESIEFSGEETNIDPNETVHIALGATPENSEIFLQVTKGLVGFFIRNFLR
jgi:hypothetical protein